AGDPSTTDVVTDGTDMGVCLINSGDTSDPGIVSDGSENPLPYVCYFGTLNPGTVQTTLVASDGSSGDATEQWVDPTLTPTDSAGVVDDGTNGEVVPTDVASDGAITPIRSTFSTLPATTTHTLHT